MVAYSVTGFQLPLYLTPLQQYPGVIAQ